MNYLLLKAVVEELAQNLTGHRVDQIFYLDKLSILLNFFHPKFGESYLYLSASNDFAAIFITESSLFASKMTTPFLNSCQNFLLGKRLFKIEVPPWERNVCLEFLDPKTAEKVYLFLEIMGKHSNLLLVNQDFIIVDAIKRYGENQSRYREVLPGKPYIPPPKPEAFLLNNLTLETFLRLFIQSPNLTLGDFFKRHIIGLGTFLLKEVFFLTNLKADTPCKELSTQQIEELYATLISLVNKNPMPVLYFNDNIPFYPAPFELKSLKDFVKQPGSPCEVSAQYYLYHRYRREFDSLTLTLKNAINKKLKNLQERIVELKAKIKEYENAQEFKNFGDLLLAFQHQVAKGSSRVKLQNWDGTPIEISLDPAKSPIENAELFYKKYQKAKKGLNIAQTQLQITQEELEYYKTLQFQVEDARSLEDLEEIKQELGIDNNPKSKKLKKTPPNFLTFTTSNGNKVYVGKNNWQNDYLTFKVAKDNDLWFHAKNIPGAHVILKCEKVPDEQSILEAAVIAATFSRARFGKKIPVDYTLRKYVHKPVGAKPGFVIYQHEKTIFVDPNLKLLQTRLPGFTTGKP
ncbi:Rqc2 family fibronectin-binding protein [Carboxydothermus pertinax]|uniref:NFACT RNA-binding domain-containing protein n=1 Tax=Carboxydothermus pertinax TaxID=870242 RepID=A0A1L8CXS8_9THEO|nr:NFACT family protein [Carboxydothermus pertinax]GAV23736.1 hypothetical protein cpu_22460 [Carboxydothermus pertinax]